MPKRVGSVVRLWHNIGAFVDRTAPRYRKGIVCINISGLPLRQRAVGPGEPLLSVRSGIVSVFVLGTARSADSKTVTMTLIFARSSVDLDAMPASSAYSIPETDLRTHASGSTSNLPSPKSSSRCTKSLKMSGSSLKLGGTECIALRQKYIPKKRRQYTFLPQSVSDVILFIVFTVIRAHVISHVFEDLANNDQHRHGYAETCEHRPQPLSVDGVLCHLEIDEKHQQRNSPSSSEFLQSAHDECLKLIYYSQIQRMGWHSVLFCVVTK